jgi:hypothetical protein
MVVPTGIGPIEGIAPSPGAGPGRIVGLRSAANVLGRAPEGVESFEALKDFNDMPASPLLGADGGRLVALGEVPPVV